MGIHWASIHSNICKALSFGVEMTEKRQKRTRLVRPYPLHELEEAIVVANTIQKVNSGLPFNRNDLANAMGIKPSSSGFTMRLNSSSKYGLTQGGYADEMIVLTARGEAVVAPNNSQERARALIDAVLEPEVFKKFFRSMHGRQIPEDTYARNMLQRELGISSALTDECLSLIKANALFVGIASESDGVLFVEKGYSSLDRKSQIVSEEHSALPSNQVHNRIFIAHGGVGAAVEFIEHTLSRFGIETSLYEASKKGTPIDREAYRSMKECAAALLVLGEKGDETNQQTTNTFNQLLGAVSVMYGERVVVVRQAGSDPDAVTPGIRVVEFESGSMGDLAIELLAEFYAAGILGVTINHSTG